MGENSFSREVRLLSPPHFENVFQKAIPSVSPQLTLLARHNSLGHARLGITVPKKRVKKACERNRVKRLVRESFRQNQRTLPNTDIVVVGKTGLDKMTNQQITQLLSRLWKKLAYRCA